MKRCMYSCASAKTSCVVDQDFADVVGEVVAQRAQ